MAQKHTINGHDVYSIVAMDGSVRASFIPARGGIGSSLVFCHKNSEQELLFQHDYFWQDSWSDLPGAWPFLFPVCARVERNGVLGNYLYDGRVYRMPMHGFAWHMPWQVVSAEKSDEFCMRLSDTAATREVYPFSFAVELLYKVGYGMLVCEQIYTNHSDRPMPYYAGFHPYFLTPQPKQGKEKVMLNFKPQQRFVYNERFTDIVGEQALFKLPISIMQPDVNEQLTKFGENKIVKLHYPDGLTLQMEVEGIENMDLFSYLQLYHMPEKPFFCVEPWMSFPNAINTVSGVRWLPPGQIERAILTLKMEK